MLNEQLIPRKTPNQEQLMAIFHEGGKVLSAGAGSGKTFVIVEHLIFRINKFKETISSDQYNIQIPRFLGRIVLMTFTNKASGEMSIRLVKRIEEMVEDVKEECDRLFWKVVLKNISHLNISTIHGFCFKLIRAGFWGDYSSKINLVSSFEHKNKIKKLVEEYFELNRERLDLLVRSNYNSFLNSMIDIFESVELRLTWEQEEKNVDHNNLDDFFKSLIEINSFQDVFERDYDSADVKQDHRVVLFLDAYFNLVDEVGVCDSTNFKKYLDFFDSIETFPQNRNLPEEISIKYNRIKKLRDDLNEYRVELMTAASNNQYLISWEKILRELFVFISDSYGRDNNWSFSDLEYYVYKGLNDLEVVSKIVEAYDYIIVDEFQDTSFVQYEILKKLSNNESKKLFMVGDRKQAIYGFRGGEIQVFAEAVQNVGVKNNLLLQNNFRSHANIIEFNNKLFEKIFPVGLGFSSIDRHAVVMEKQICPSTTKEGKVESLNAVFESDEKLNLNSLEAEVLHQKISELIEDEEIKTICILYRQLAPSSYLIEKLLDSKMHFKAQLKIKFHDDPIIIIFRLLLECALNTNDVQKLDSSKYILDSYLRTLESKGVESDEIDKFLINKSLFGIAFAFKKFIFDMGLSNSLFAVNYPLVESLIKISGEDLNYVYANLNSFLDESYSIDSITGKFKKNILIMTAHASKGLEFDAVLLGGIYTNGTIKSSKNLIGKMPGSFQYKLSLMEKKFLKSPRYLIENLISKHKDFSESKRLLYVACTRAVKYLGFADMFNIKKGKCEELKFGNNCWIAGLRLLSTETKNINTSSIKFSSEPFNLKEKDWLGLKSGQNNLNLAILPELSVTRLAILIDCSFKFYLSSVLKISVSKEVGFYNRDAEEFYSSKKRGTELHNILSDLVTEKIDISRLKHKDIEKINWAYQLFLDEKNKKQVMSERLLRFSFLGQMISGTPDLYFFNEEEVVIWDFKTGLRDEQKESSYWFQLNSYALALKKLYLLNQETKFKLVLIYLDEMNFVTKYLRLDEVEQNLFAVNEKIKNFNQVNHSHCPRCEYSGICNKKG